MTLQHSGKFGLSSGKIGQGSVKIGLGLVKMGRRPPLSTFRIRPALFRPPLSRSMKVKDNVVFTNQVLSSPFYLNIQFLKNVVFYFISFNFCLEISGLRLLKGARRKLVSFVIAT